MNLVNSPEEKVFFFFSRQQMLLRTRLDHTTPTDKRTFRGYLNRQKTDISPGTRTHYGASYKH